MTPDKIYVHEISAEELTKNLPYHICYIRRDALLEWAKDQKRDCERVIREHPEDESLWCERDKYDELIDKLNSM